MYRGKNMAQTIKSLQQQIEKINIAGFSVNGYKKGDYGYNLVCGTLDNEIEIYFKVFYQKENDEAIKEVQKSIEQDIAFVKFIQEKLLPKDCKLIKFIDGEFLYSFKLGLEIDGKTIEFYLLWAHCVKDNTPPVYYPFNQLVTNIESAVKNYTKNFKILLNFPKFKYENHSVVSNLTNKHPNALNIIVNGSAFGVNGSFIVRDFENANIKKILKQQLKIFKNKSKNKKLATTDNELVDFRNYAELIDALKKENKLTTQFNNDSTPEKQNTRDEFCKNTLIPIAKEINNQLDAKFIKWRTGEEVSWKELFPDNFFEDRDYNCIRMIRILFDRGWTGKYVWKNDIITVSGSSIRDEKGKLLKLGQDVNHNLDTTYDVIRTDDIVLDGDNKIVLNKETRKSDFAKQITIETISDSVDRLTHNIKIFKNNEDKYKANAMIAIFYSFLGETEKSKQYKKVVDKIKINNVKLDKKIENLLSAIK